MSKHLEYIEIFETVKNWHNLNADYTDHQLSPEVIRSAHSSGTLLYDPGKKLVITTNNPRKNWYLVPGEEVKNNG